MIEVDVAIVGAGIAGSSLAAALSPSLRVAVLEQETHPGLHSTGRSAAMYSAVYGNTVVRALSRSTHDFLSDPPVDFTEHPLLKTRGVVVIAREDQGAAMHRHVAEYDDPRFVEHLDADAVLRRLPVLRPDQVAEGLFEPGAAEIDVNALHTGYLRRARGDGATVVSHARVTAVERSGSAWVLTTTAGVFRSAVIVDAAGAWGDEVAALAGVAPIGLEARRRTAILVDAPLDAAIETWPMVVDVEESFYFKPDAGRILVSPADEAVSPACDAQPEDLDVAIAVDRLETATTVQVRRVHSRWAGLRTFVADESPVIGFDPQAQGFFWLVGQGGFGVQACQSMAQIAAALILDTAPPEVVASGAIEFDSLRPRRPMLAA